MSKRKLLSSLGKSWERDDILLKIKNGLCTDDIVNEFLANNEKQIKELNSLLRSEDIDLLNQIEKLSTCESKLINKIKNLHYLENNKNYHILNQNKINLINKLPSNQISSFMIKWSNKFIVITLLIISAIALTKQAWA